MAPATLSLLGPPMESNTAANPRLPSSCQRVLALLMEAGALTHSDVAQRTGMPNRTIRFAVRRLREEGLIGSVPSLRDCRTRYLFVQRAPHLLQAPPGQVAPFVVGTFTEGPASARPDGVLVIPLAG